MKYILNSQQLEEERQRRQEEDVEGEVDSTMTTDTGPTNTNDSFELDQYKIYMPSSESLGTMTFENDFETLASPTSDEWDSLQYPKEDETQETFSMQYVHLGLAAALGFLINMSNRSK